MKRRTREEWFDIINNQKNSGLSIKNYCIKNNISTCNFYKYKKLLINDNSNHDSCDNQFLPVQICDYNNKVIFTLDGHTIECDAKDLKLILGGLI